MAAPLVTPHVTLTPVDPAVGSPVEMKFRFEVASNATFGEDHVLFVHFLDQDRELMWTDDHMPPVPTSQWKSGTTVEYTRETFIPRFPYVGEVRVEVGLVSPKTGERVPMAGENKGQRSIQVATFNMRLQSDNVFVVFKDGWQATEVSGEGAGLEWQWSKKEGILALRNPMRDAVLYLLMDQPVSEAGQTRVEVRIGAVVLDSFTVAAADGRVLRKVPVSQGQFGGAETVEIVVAVDKTFVPATIPSMKNSDARELGIRLFRAFIQPK